MENSTKKIFETIFQCIFGLFEFPIKTWEKFRNDKYCKILQKLLIYLCTALAWWPGGSLLLDPGRSSRVLAAALIHLGLAAAGGDGADHPGRHPLNVHVQVNPIKILTTRLALMPDAEQTRDLGEDAGSTG